MIHKAEDLSPDQRVAVESLLGRPILAGEAISVRAFEPASLSDQRRREIVEALTRYFAEVDASRTELVSAQEVEETIIEALRSSRPHYTPHQ